MYDPMPTNIGSDRRMSIIEETHAALDELDKTVAILTERLSPVMRTEYAEPNMASVPEMAVSPIRSQLARIYTATSRLSGLVERLEV